MRLRLSILFFFAMLFNYGCVSIPDNVQPVDEFELDRYLGTWYEIARLDHSFERGLSQVTATYSMRDDGGVKVINKGFDVKKNEWDEAEGKAYFVGDPAVGRLKVSFFGPFYGGYNIIELDKEHYQYSLVCGPDKSYLWILARDPNIDKTTVEGLVAKAKKLGFSTEELIYVNHVETP
jgi:apolipoprotein D and lipocalin family protein